MENIRILGISTYRPEEIAEPIGRLEGSKHISIDHTKGFVNKYVSAFINAGREVSTGEYDVVIVSSPGLLSFFMCIVCLVHTTPLIIRLIGNYWRVSDIMMRRSVAELNISSIFRSSVRSILSKISFILVDGCIVVSEDLVEVVERNTSVRRENISVVHYPINLDRYTSGYSRNFVEQYHIQTEKILSVIFHAEFYPKYRGFKDLIRLINRVLCDYSDVSLVVAGWGEHYDKLVSDFDHDRIHFVGYVENIPDLYAATDILLYNSYMDGYPNVILEAQAAGVPVISNPKFGMREQISHLETGVLAQLDGQYESYIREMLDGKIDIRKLGYNSQQAVREHNTPESISQDLSHGVENIIGNK